RVTRVIGVARRGRPRKGERRLCECEFSSDMSGRFSALSRNSRGGEFVKVGAYNPIVFLYRTSSRQRPVSGNVGIIREEPRRRRQGKKSSTLPKKHRHLGQCLSTWQQPFTM